MGGLFVRDGGFLRAVDFHQDEVGGVVVVLQDVEAGDAGFLCRFKHQGFLHCLRIVQRNL